MTKSNPEQAFAHWFNALPLWQRHALAYLYYLMTSGNSADFALTGAESMQRLLSDLVSADFPIRRVSRLLSIRAIFGFIFQDAEFARQFVLTKAAGFTGDSVQITGYQWLRDEQSWQRLCLAELSDVSLHQWLLSLDP